MGIAPQWGDESIIAETMSKADNLCQWLTEGSIGTYATETFMTQVATPSSVLIRRRGTLIEHALLLCSFFRGLHVNAYVAIGEVKSRPYVWVVTIMPRNMLHNHLSPEHPMITSKPIKDPPTTIEFVEEKTTHVFNLKDFLKHEAVQSEINFKNNFSVLHWDPLSGACFDSRQSSKVPFDILNTLFNEKNIWFNVQYTPICKNPMFCWNLENTDKWLPFLTGDMLIKPGQIEPHCKPIFFGISYCV